MYRASGSNTYFLRVYQIDWYPGMYIVQQTGSGIDIQRSTNYHKNICFIHIINSSFNHRHSLSKPDNKRPELRAIGCLVSHPHLIFLRFKLFYKTRIIGLKAGSHFRKFPMQMNYLYTPCTFVQIIHILGNHSHMKIFLQLC